MRAPCFANANAQAAPIPRDAPVISTPRGGALDAENDSEIAVSLILSLSIPDKTGCRSLLTCLSPLYPLQCLWFCCNVSVCRTISIFTCKKCFIAWYHFYPYYNFLCSFYNILYVTSSCMRLNEKPSRRSFSRQTEIMSTCSLKPCQNLK